MSEFDKSVNSIEEFEEQTKIIPELDVMLKEKLLELPGAIEYIEKLQRILQKLVKKIRKLKSKIAKNEKNYTHAFTQTNTEHFNSLTDVSLDSEQTEIEPRTLTEGIKEAAEAAMQNMGFVYEETSGMYYDYNTGYYYNAEYGLYYDSKTRTYFNYNAEKQTYEFHSQVSVHPQAQQELTETQGSRQELKQKKRTKKSLHKDSKRQCDEEQTSKVVNEDVEEGECSDSDDVSSDSGSGSDLIEVSKQWPPCMRIIVESSDIPSIKIGSLHIITFDGGTLGREGNHSILIPDLNISKHHLKFEFNKTADYYTVIDLGSRNGTLLNGKRMSPSKQESESMEITHGSKIQVGSTVLLCHIHNGNHTCIYCEPGLTGAVDENDRVVKPSRIESHKKQLKNLKKIYGLTQQEPDIKLADGYTDRAQKRRDNVGSLNHHEKTQIASVDESISKENKGFKLLSKMGWKEGESLGKTGGGLLEPVQLSSNISGAGLGSTEVMSVTKTNEKTNIWAKTQERFQKLPESNRAFEDTSD